jgi:plastocyanin
MTALHRTTLPAIALGFLLAASAWGQHLHHAPGTKVDYDPEPGGGDPTAPPNCAGVTAKVIVRDSSFSVPEVTVDPGQPVCWTWTGTEAMHNVKADNGTFTSGMPDTHGNFQVTFSTPGTYGYYCQVHGSPTGGMRGMVIVRDTGGGGGGEESGPGKLELSSSYTVDEGAGVVTISVEREGGHDGAASVTFATAPGTAKPGKDFLTRKGTLSWADGDGDPKTFDVTIKNDGVIEPDKTFSIKLSKAKGAPLGTSTATVTIHDDDTPGCGAPLTAPVQLVARGQSASEIRLTWDDDSAVESALKIERRRPTGAFQEIASLPAGTTTFTDTGLPAGATFQYRVKAIGSDGFAAVSEIVAGATDGPTTPCDQKRSGLCLADGRFEASVEWNGAASAAGGESKRLALPEAPSSGLFSHPTDPDLQLLLTVVDGCAVNDHYGLNLATTADAELTVRVRDTVTGHAWVFYNPAGNVPAPVRDVDALACR